MFTRSASVMLIFFFNDTATTEIYTLSLHDALPISADAGLDTSRFSTGRSVGSSTSYISSLHLTPRTAYIALDRKSTRLNSSHANISYAVFCLKNKKATYKSIVVNVRDAHDYFRGHV